MPSTWFGEISVPTFIVVALFAISSWVDINGVWVELPLLVDALPEKWNLPSFMTIIIQVANIGPLLYAITRKVSPKKVREWPVIYLTMTIGAISCLLLGFFWSHTSFVAGKERSTALLVLLGFLSLVDCTSSVVSLPYMARFPAQYLTAFYIGEGLSGLIPALIGLSQGLGRDPVCQNQTSLVTVERTFPSGDSGTGNRSNTTIVLIDSDRLSTATVALFDPPLFPVSTFFFMLFGMLCVSIVSFSLLHFHPHCRQQTTYSFRSKLEQKTYPQARAERDIDSRQPDLTAAADAAETAAETVVVQEEPVTSSWPVKEPAVPSTYGAVGSAQNDVVTYCEHPQSCAADDAIVVDYSSVVRETEEELLTSADTKIDSEAGRSGYNANGVEASAVDPVDGGGSSLISSDRHSGSSLATTSNRSMTRRLLPSMSDSTASLTGHRDVSDVSITTGSSSTSRRQLVIYILLTVLVGWTNALTNGILPSLQSYSCLPYGKVAYTLAVRLSAAVNPLACFLALFVQVRSTPGLALLTVSGSLLAGYHVTLATFSPSPWLMDTPIGATLAVASFVTMTALLSYFKVCAAARLAAEAGASGLLWCGCATQIGSLCGASVAFVVIGVFDLFTSKLPCT